MVMYLLFSTVPIISSIIVTLCYKKSIKVNDRDKKILLLCCGIAMFLMIALRHKELGSTDSAVYFNHWELLSGLSLSGFKSFLKDAVMEPGYCFFVWCFSHIFPQGQFVFIISALIFTISVCRFIYLNSSQPELSFVMYITLGLYSFMVQGLRQSIAMSICLFAIELCKKRKFIPFILVVLLATLFHKSAIVFVIVYFIYGFTLNIRSGALALLMSVILFAFSDSIISIGNQAFDRNYGTEVESGGYVAVAIYILILIFAVVFAGKKRKDKDYSFFVFFTLVGAVFYLMRYVEAQVAERISFYFMFGQIIALPNAINNFDKKVSFILKTIIMILCILLYAYRLSDGDLIDYRFFWQEIL